MRLLLLNRYLLTSIAMILIISGCVTTNYNYFQDGKPSGAGMYNITKSITIGAKKGIQYEKSGEDTLGIEYNDTLHLSPLVNIDYRWGITDRIDAGVGGSIGLLQIGLRGFAKICLEPKNPKLGIAILPVISFATTPDEITTFDEINMEIGQFFGKATLIQLSLAIPFSYEINSRVTIVLSPQLCREKLDFELSGFSESYKYVNNGITIGFKIRGNNSHVYPEISLISWNGGKRYYPYFGIGISRNISKNKSNPE